MRGLDAARISGRVNVVTQGNAGKGNAVMTFGPGTLSLRESAMPLRITGEAKQVEILYVEPFDGYRIQFDWYPTSDSVDPVEMRMFLRCQGEAISETWLWQYFPPAPDKRKYVDDRQMR
ncbi:Glucans biosynthesis protein D precursor [Cronobacter sakazakii 696]|nr:Glucans biosynthesis protein D precursor [Cronobacter sakazakii 696]